MEVEVKYRESDLKRLEARLNTLGARFLGDFKEIDVYFQHPLRDFHKTDEALRLRIVDGEYELTYKGPRSNTEVKSREEITVKVDNIEKMQEILKRLGFRPIAKLVKLRRKYILNDCIVSLDRVEHLGSFVEIEALSSAENPIETVLNTTKLLQLKGSIMEKTYLELLLEKNDKT